MLLIDFSNAKDGQEIIETAEEVLLELEYTGEDIQRFSEEKVIA